MAGKYKGKTINCACWQRTLYAVWVAKTAAMGKEYKYYSPLLQGDKQTVDECKKVLASLSLDQLRQSGLTEDMRAELLA
jgi:hypothetical protein